MKKFIILSILSIVVLSSFYVGTKFSGGNSSVEQTPEPVKYDMIGYYLAEDRDFSAEAKEIQSTYKTPTSK